MNLDGLISYSIPQGDKYGYDVQLFDEVYDGENENGIWEYENVENTRLIIPSHAQLDEMSLAVNVDASKINDILISTYLTFNMTRYSIS